MIRFLQWRRKVHPDWQDLWDDANELPHTDTCPQARPTLVPEDIYPPTYIADRAINDLNDPVRGDAPFFMFISSPDPHHPFIQPGRSWDINSSDDLEISLPGSAHRNPPPPLVGWKPTIACKGPISVLRRRSVPLIRL